MERILKYPSIALLALALAGCLADSGSSGPEWPGSTTGQTADEGATSDSAPGDDTVSGDGQATEAESLMKAVEHNGLTRRDIDTTTISEDGTEIAMTVFLPHLNRNEAAPVIVHSHGWGESRLTELGPSLSSNLVDRELTHLFSFVPEEGLLGNPDFIGDAPGEAAWRARNNGAIVVSYDQRGFGESGGKASLMDPALEGRDFSAVLDFIEDEYGRYLMRSREDLQPRVGTLGYSYGGGFQWVGASLDDRVDAVVPTATWFDLSYSLHSGDMPKTSWLTILLLLGGIGTEFNLDDDLYENAARVFTLGLSAKDSFLERIARHGLKAYCDGRNQDAGGLPAVDALIIQGVEDTLFNMNESVAAFDCLRDSDHDVSLIVQRTGHSAPLTDIAPGTFGFGMERELSCGDETWETSKLIHEFLDSRLRGEPEALTPPKTCVTLDGREGIVADDIQRGGELFTPGDRTYRPSSDPLSSLVSLDLGDFLNFGADSMEKLSPSMRVALFEADQDMALAGIPTIEVTLDATLSEPTLFAGLYLEKAGEEQGRLINNQVIPLRGLKNHRVDMAGVSQPLEAGDRVSLAFYSFHPLYFYNEDFLGTTFNQVELKNTMIELPLHR